MQRWLWRRLHGVHGSKHTEASLLWIGFIGHNTCQDIKKAQDKLTPSNGEKELKKRKKTREQQRAERQAEQNIDCGTSFKKKEKEKKDHNIVNWNAVQRKHNLQRE